ncbi:hypothetical protein ACFVHB_33745 [Kitasatospora sp. NPDC127111]|uniref:hypothetical protein n=1 Tax=Kitasatospora sp. NPDC127111 TaxID=3345363 RepID=UPI00363E7B9C
MQSRTTSAEDGLRRLLNAWDPIGVADESPDEYACMLAPVLARLHAGAGQAEVEAFLRHELVDHFGLDPLGLRPDAMAARVIAWWTAAAPTNGTNGA